MWAMRFERTPAWHAPIPITVALRAHQLTYAKDDDIESVPISCPSENLPIRARPSSMDITTTRFAPIYQLKNARETVSGLFIRNEDINQPVGGRKESHAGNLGNAVFVLDLCVRISPDLVELVLPHVVYRAGNEVGLHLRAGQAAEGWII
jgi:hypothetical protein